MSKSWFRPLGWIYYPVSVPGALITVLFILFCLQVFVAIDRNSHSVSDTFYGIFPYWVPAFLVYLWIGMKTSESRGRASA
jgi:hypothetical protein